MTRKVTIFCEGEKTQAAETIPGVFRCERCGDKVKVVVPRD